MGQAIGAKATMNTQTKVEQAAPIARPYRTQTFSSAASRIHQKKTHSLRDDFSKDDNHSSRDNDRTNTSSENIIQENRQRFIDNLACQLGRR